MKRIMLLGGNHIQMTATKAAKDLGHYVISCDYLPENPAHKLADEYHNVSTIDKEAVLALAKTLDIDGIVSYSSDVSAPTVAYVAQELGLVGNPLESVEILTHKHLFRDFLREHGFPCPESRGFSQGDYEEALAFFREMKKTVMVKPVDSCGSKGVHKVEKTSDFALAFEDAMAHSIGKKIIVEEFIQRVGYQIDGDGFVVEGEVVFFAVMDQHKDLDYAPYTPIGHSMPSVQNPAFMASAKKQIQEIFNILKHKSGAFNFEYIVDEQDRVHILEIGPRNGGNFITDTIKVATGVDLAQYTIQAALGLDCSDLKETEATRCASSFMVHSLEDGIFQEIVVEESLEKQILSTCLFIEKGDKVQRFLNASHSIGAMVIEFKNQEEMCELMDHMNQYIQVRVESVGDKEQ